MNYDREDDILYLAHQLWEEADEPRAAPQTYWMQAAIQVLARERGHRGRDAAPARSGLAVHIDMGTAPRGRHVTLISRCEHAKVANGAPRLVRLAD